MNDGAIMFFKYVKRADVPRYLEAGWIMAQVGVPCHHDDYACILEWTGIGEPPDMPPDDSNLDCSEHDRRSDGRT